MSEDTDPLVYLFTRPIGSSVGYSLVVLKHADRLPIPNSEIGTAIAELREKGLECVQYSVDNIPSDLAQLVRKTCGVKEVVETKIEIPSESLTFDQLAKRGWK
ncbi:MAG: hypothetical protein Q7K43_03660 [Candidatus Woesearchaeota archaeon]|nr:hypothetical protein [Candidatus Woesearchaeota archaeon]